jgi:hypothetical protein
VSRAQLEVTIQISSYSNTVVLLGRGAQELRTIASLSPVVGAKLAASPEWRRSRYVAIWRCLAGLGSIVDLVRVMVSALGTVLIRKAAAADWRT